MSSVHTFTGRSFSFADCKPEDVCLIDIAQSLSMSCRYNGHCLRHTSVAAHSVRVAQALGARKDNLCRKSKLGLSWIGLMHDAPEAYIGDVPTPLKIAMRMVCDQEKSPYDKIEDTVTAVVAEALGINQSILGDDITIETAWHIVSQFDYADFVAESSVECRRPWRPLSPDISQFPQGHDASTSRALWLDAAIAYAPTQEMVEMACMAQRYFHRKETT